MTVDRRDFIAGSAALAGILAARPVQAGSPSAVTLPVVPVSIDTRRATGPLHHVWEECAGSDRAAITLRESWRQDWDRGHKELGLKRVRFHGIFNDELGVYAPSWLNGGKPPKPNFRNIFEVYDGLIDHGVSPYIELSFMPQALASSKTAFGFYNGNTSPPKTNEAWADFIALFVKALIGRYGLATVRQWPFEVWNEPDLRFFWSGTPQQYFDMYKATALSIKAIDPQLQVGGPSTSQTQWIAEFAAWTAANAVPVDFFATHCYASDPQAKIFGPGTAMPQYDVIPAAIKKARGAIDATVHKGKPLYLSEWSSDSPAIIAHVIKDCLPHLQAMSHWVLSGTYEEIGVPDFQFTEGDNGFFMMINGIPRANYNTYKLLHQLGQQRLAADGPVLASRRADGVVAAAVWNLADVTQPMGIPGQTNNRKMTGSAKTMAIHFAGVRAGAPVKVQFVDQERGSPYPAWRKLGSPRLMTRPQMAELKRAAEIAPPISMHLNATGTLALDLPPEGLALITL